MYLFPFVPFFLRTSTGQTPGPILMVDGRLIKQKLHDLISLKLMFLTELSKNHTTYGRNKPMQFVFNAEYV